MNVLTPKTTAEVFCNCKIESYPKFKKITIANRPVFKDKAWECRKATTKGTEKRISSDNAPQLRSVHRAKKKIFDIAALNAFDYFVTLTLDPRCINRENPREVAKKLKTFLAHKVTRKSWSYVLVPEYHKDQKGIHLHGLISGNIQLKDSGMKTKEGKTVYNLPEWNYGFSTCIELSGEKKFVSRYITKYISKDFKKIFGNFYYAGGKLLRRPPTTYTNADYDNIDAKGYEVNEIGVSFKYVEVEGGEESEA